MVGRCYKSVFDTVEAALAHWVYLIEFTTFLLGFLCLSVIELQKGSLYQEYITNYKPAAFSFQLCKSMCDSFLLKTS